MHLCNGLKHLQGLRNRGPGNLGEAGRGRMGKRVLVADDEPLTTEMLGAFLAFEGFEVVAAHDGHEALERARETRPDVVLLDEMMPQLLGTDVVRTIRQDPALAETPVVLLSCVDESDVDWKGAGATAFLQKPFEIRKVGEMVRQLVDRGERAA